MQHRKRDIPMVCNIENATLCGRMTRRRVYYRWKATLVVLFTRESDIGRRKAKAKFLGAECAGNGGNAPKIERFAGKWSIFRKRVVGGLKIPSSRKRSASKSMRYRRRLM